MRSLDELLGKVAAAGVRRLFLNVLFLRSPTKEKYLRWLAREYPQHLAAYEAAYAGRVYLHGPYRDGVSQMVRRLRERHRFRERREDERPVYSAEQLRLF